MNAPKSVEALSGPVSGMDTSSVAEEMTEACRGLIAMYEGNTPPGDLSVITRARSAIAKAEAMATEAQHAGQWQVKDYADGWITFTSADEAMREVEAMGEALVRYHDDMRPTPLGALRFRMEQGGYTQVDLARLVGSRGRASEILSGKRALSKTHIRRLVDEWGIPASSLISMEPGK